MRITLIAFVLLPTLLLSQIQPEDITIIRDQWGVPHIYGKTDADVAYGLAWAHGEDNFHDIQTNLIVSRARLGEVKGKAGAAADYVIQLIKMREVVEEKYDSDVSPEFKKVLEAYCEGINGYAQTHPDEVRLKDFFPVYPHDVLVAYGISQALLAGFAPVLENALEGRPAAPTGYSPRGSNAFAFNSNKTADGQVYLVNNAHQPLEGPSSWYEAHLISEEGQNCLGGLFPGGVSIFAGCTPQIAWAHTVNGSDFVDVFRLEMHPTEPNRYRFDGDYKMLEEYKVKLKVKIGPFKVAVKRKAWWSVYGATIRSKQGEFFSFRLPANQGIQAAEQWHQMNKATHFSEFYEALDRGGICSMNIVYADANDTIFYIDNGNYPFRDRAFDWQGVLPGDTSATLWEDFHSTEELVQVLQPRSGYVYNTNNRPFSSTAPADCPDPAEYDPTMGNFHYENNRSLRFQELISALDRVSWKDFKQIKFDRTYPDSMYLHYMENFGTILELDPLEFPEIKEEIDILNAWNRDVHPDSVGATVFMLALNHYLTEAKKDHRLYSAKVIPKATYAAAIQFAGQHLQKHFGTKRVPLGKVQRLVRGNEDYPLGGTPEVLASMKSIPWEKGRYRGIYGESYIQFVRFSESGVAIESIHSYGSSNKPESPHFSDQAGLFVEQQTKEMSLDREWIEAHAERSYHPGESP